MGHYRQLAKLMMASLFVSINITIFFFSCQLLTQGTRPNYVSLHLDPISARVTMRLASTLLRVQFGHRPCGWKISKHAWSSLERVWIFRGTRLVYPGKDKKKFKSLFSFLVGSVLILGLSALHLLGIR